MEYSPVACMHPRSFCCFSDSFGCFPRDLPLARLMYPLTHGSNGLIRARALTVGGDQAGVSADEIFRDIQVQKCPPLRRQILFVGFQPTPKLPVDQSPNGHVSKPFAGQSLCQMA